MELLISILIVAGVLGISGLALYLREKHLYNPADIAYVQSAFNLGMDIVNELNLKQEPQIRLIAQIVSDILNQILKVETNEDEATLEANAMKTIQDALIAAKITITPEREKIVQALVDTTLNNIEKKIV